MTFTEIRNQLVSGDFGFLVGLVEDEHFDAKNGKYDLSSEAAKQELAKDISSFANRSGGLIIIGLQTSNDALFYGRRVASISTVPFSMINPPDYHNVIKDWIYPRPKEIEIDWVVSKEEPTKGLAYIFVPNQPENLRPFLIKKDIDPATNRKRKEILFGYVERISHSSDPVGIESLHTMFRLGRENRWKEDVGVRLAAIEAKISEPPEVSKRKQNLEQIVFSRLEKALEASGLRDHRTYCLAVSPVDTTEVQSILSSTASSIAKLMEEPPELRYGGWAMETGDSARLIDGELRRVKSDGYKILEVYRDGTFIFACRADEALLGWGPTFGKTRINPLALIETTYMYFSFYEHVLKRFQKPANKLQVWIQFRNLHAQGMITSLAPHGVEAFSHRSGLYQRNAPETKFNTRIDIDPANFEPAQIALRALKETYAWFGIEDDKIPYTTADGNAVNVEMIKNLKA